MSANLKGGLLFWQTCICESRIPKIRIFGSRIPKIRISISRIPKIRISGSRFLKSRRYAFLDHVSRRYAILDHVFLHLNVLTRSFSKQTRNFHKAGLNNTHLGNVQLIHPTEEYETQLVEMTTDFKLGVHVYVLPKKL